MAQAETVIAYLHTDRPNNLMSFSIPQRDCVVKRCTDKLCFIRMYRQGMNFILMTLHEDIKAVVKL